MVVGCVVCVCCYVCYDYWCDGLFVLLLGVLCVGVVFDCELFFLFLVVDDYWYVDWLVGCDLL